jgi:hypothetical protein
MSHVYDVKIYVFIRYLFMKLDIKKLSLKCSKKISCRSLTFDYLLCVQYLKAM